MEARMDYGRAFTFMTGDQNWMVKLLIGAVIAFLSFLILPVFLLVGYTVAVTRRVMAGQELPLPEWTDDIGKLFMDGLFVWIAQLVYTLPFWLLLCIGFASTVGFGALSDVSEELAAGAILTTWGITGCLTLIFALALAIISPAIVIQYVRTGEFGACFRFGEVLGIARDQFVPILISALAVIGVSLVISFISGALQIIPCIGTIIGLVIAFLMTPYIIIASGHLYGQIARNVDNKKVAY